VSNHSQPQSHHSALVPAWREIGAAAGAAGSPPLITVIVPFEDPRGHPDYLAGWTRDQSLESALYEVIVVVSRSDETEFEELRAYLRPQDRLIGVDAHERFALYAAGAEAARGALLVITEDHCIAEADCLAAVKRHFESTNDACATVRWGHINHNSVARLEERLSHIDEKVWFRPDDWNKVRARGFAIRRDAYWDVGGFDWPYELFAEAVLSARLHSRGHRVGHITESGVRHINTETLGELLGNAWSYSWGECSYCDTHDPDFCEHYFAASTVLERDNLVPGRLGNWMAFALLRVLVRDRALIGKGKSSLWGALTSLLRLVCVPFEFPLRRLLVWPRVWSARFRVYLWRFNEERQFRAFSQFWRRVVEAARLVYAGKHGLHASRQITMRPLEPRNFIVQGGTGCFGVEHYQALAFRWTSPVAVLQLALPAGNYRLVIDTGRLQGRSPSIPLGVYWNRRLAPRRKVRWKHSVMSLEIKQGRCRKGPTQELTLACAPALRSDGDRRWRGLPICSVEVLPVDSADGKPLKVSRNVDVGVAQQRSSTTKSDAAIASVVDTETAPRVVIVNTSDRGGGAETVAWKLFKGYQRRGMKARMWVGQRTTDDPDVLHSFHQLRSPPDSSFSGFKRRLIKTAGARLGWEDFEFPTTRRLRDECGTTTDLIHCHNLHGGYFDLRELAALSLQIPVFVTLHDCWLFTGHCAFTQECRRWEKGCGHCPDLMRLPAVQSDATAYNWRRKARIFARSKLYIATPSAWLLEKVQRSMLAPGMVERRVIQNGIDLNIFYPVEKRAARSQLPVSDEGPLLVFAAKDGAANPHKDFATLRASLAELPSANGPVHCVVIGRAAATEELSNGVRIYHLPPLGNKQVAGWLQAADLCVHATRDESFSLVAAEALACGTPVVASKVGGLPEVVRDRQDGLLVPGRDPRAFAVAIAQLLREPARRMHMGREGAAWAARRFDSERMVNDYVQWFDKAARQQALRHRVSCEFPRMATSGPSDLEEISIYDQ
jgi:glycosyltransferase involved in cell wall biosynthesis